MATACPERAVRLAKLVENDVSAIDVNMGCPLPFSTAGGMGAALLTRPEQSKSILKALVDSSKLPVTCKIRLVKLARRSFSFYVFGEIFFL